MEGTPSISSVASPRRLEMLRERRNSRSATTPALSVLQDWGATAAQEYTTLMEQSIEDLICLEGELSDSSPPEDSFPGIEQLEYLMNGMDIG